MDLGKQIEICGLLNKEIHSHSRIIYCNRIDEYSDVWNKSFHKHEFLEILYFIKGEALVEGDKEDKTTLSANDLIVYLPGYGHKEYVDFSRHQEVVCIAIELRRSFQYHTVLSMSDISRQLEWIFVELHKQYQLGEKDIVRQLKYLLFSYINQNSGTTVFQNQNLTLRIQDYLKKHYRERVSQTELCELVHVSPSYLNRIFKADTGQTPVEFLNRIRIDEASNLIKKNTLTIEAVAAHVGIGDPKYFSKVFKKITGVSPREFRQQY